MPSLGLNDIGSFCELAGLAAEGALGRLSFARTRQAIRC